jgi:hypothetical protein
MRKAALVFIFLIGVVFLWRLGNNQPDSSKSDTVQLVKATVRSCTAADFSLSKEKATEGDDEATLTGVITSRCSAAAGVQLKWTAFNTDGTVAFSSDFWPASTTNIPPKSDYPFEMMNAAPRGKWTYTVEPISTNVW